MFDDEILVTVASFTTVTEAEAARLMLDAEGLNCFMTDAEIVNMDWLISNAVGGVKLQVPESQAERATKLLAGFVGRRKHRHVDDYGLDRITTAETRIAAQLPDDTEEPDDEEEEADKIVDRAFKAAVVGLLFCPPVLHFYSAWLLLQIPGSPSTVSANKRKVLLAAVVLDLVGLLEAAAFLWYSRVVMPML